MTQREVLDNLNNLGFNVRKIAELTGIPEARIYKWYSGAGLPKLDDFNKLKDLFERMKPNPTNDFGYINKEEALKLLNELIITQKQTIDLLNRHILELEEKARAPVIKTKTGG